MLNLAHERNILTGVRRGHTVMGYFGGYEPKGIYKPSNFKVKQLGDTLRDAASKFGRVRLIIVMSPVQKLNWNEYRSSK